MLPSVGQQLWSDRASFGVMLLPPIALAVCLPVAWARTLPVRGRNRAAADVGLIALLVAMFCVESPGGGEQAASPDVLYLASMGRLALAQLGPPGGGGKSPPRTAHCRKPVPAIAHAEYSGAAYSSS